jgi:hypothetical protein
MSPGGRQGINQYFYRRAERATRNPNGMIDPLAVSASGQAGELVYYDADVPPGSNRLETLLNVVLETPDPRPLLDALSEVSQHILLPATTFPVVHMAKDVGLAFYVAYPLKPLARQDFIYFGNRAARLLQKPPEKSLRDLPPFTVRARREEDQVTYELESQSEKRLRNLKGNLFVPSRVVVSHQNAADLEQLVGGFVGHLGSAITHLTEDELLRNGGVLFVDEASGKTLAAWPSRPAFEERVASWLTELGANLELVPQSRDQGADVIFTHNGRRVAVECKVASIVDVAHVKQVYTAKHKYGCQDAWLVASGGFTSRARNEAQHRPVTLIEDATRERVAEAFANLGPS